MQWKDLFVQVDSTDVSVGIGPDPEAVDVVRGLLKIGDIYQHSSVRLLIMGSIGGNEFRLVIRSTDPRSQARVVNLSIGKANGLESEITSECKGDRHVIDASITGLLNELPIRPGGEGTGPQSVLGVRWYPFISSRLCASLAISGATFTAFSITASDAVRLRRDSPVWSGKSTAMQRARSYDADAWTVSIGWEHLAIKRIALDVPLQTSAATLSRLINGTVIGAALSFVTIAVAAELASAYLAFGALGALALLLVREWRAGPRAHHLTALGAIYIGYIGFGLGWSLAWVIGGLWALSMLPLALIICWWVLRTVPTFEAIGHPPESFSRPLRALMTRRERARQRRRDRMRRSMVRRLLGDMGSRMRRAQDGDYYVVERGEQVLLRLRPLDDEPNHGTLDSINEHGLWTTPMVVDDMATFIDELRRSRVAIDPDVRASLETTSSRHLGGDA